MLDDLNTYELCELDEINELKMLGESRLNQ